MHGFAARQVIGRNTGLNNKQVAAGFGLLVLLTAGGCGSKMDAKQDTQGQTANKTPAPQEVSPDTNSASSSGTSASNTDNTILLPRQPIALPMTAADKRLAHIMPNPDAYPEDGPQQTLALFLNAWKHKNWQQMTQQTQSGWSSTPADELYGDFDLQELRGANLGEMKQATSGYADISTTIYSVAAGPHPQVQKFSGVVHLIYDTDNIRYRC